jgi:alkylhydroperoxidase/carboxymuconolactone decarboxylase family protein YurZ
MSGEANFSEQVAAIAPEVAAGYAQVRATIERDGALPASFKALVCAVCASVLGQLELAERELARGRELGLADREVGIAGVALLLSRGEVQTQRFIDLAGGLDPASTPRPPSELGAEAYFLDYLGVDALPARMAIMQRYVPEVFAGYQRMHHGVLAADPAATRSSEVLLVGVNAAELQTRFIAIHAATARKAGATDQQLVESVVCAIPATGIAAWAAGAEGLFADA